MSFGVYVHWPWCARICPYCDFNVYRARGQDAASLIAAIADDASALRARIGARPAQTVFLGGGTPSLLSGVEIGALLDAVDAAFPIAKGAEITLEANPEDSARFADHVAAGVNRLSLGVQALDDGALTALGRTHTTASAIAALDAAAATGARVSADFIYAREGQTLSAWEAELRHACALPVEHLSLYQLTIEPGTAFARAAARGRALTPPPELAADFYELTQAITADAGFDAYEISNHARGEKAQSAHNRIYWAGKNWAGLGPGAHGRITMDGQRWGALTPMRPADYVANPRPDWEAISAEDDATEKLLMGLRVVDGLDPAPLEALRGRAFDAVKLADLRGLGLLDAGPFLRLTAAGRLVADQVALELLEERRR
jgi:putative oxygen-independent coproporphyrinogen III oxidase